MNRTLARLIIIAAISHPRKEPRMNTGPLWTIVAVLAIIALLIFIIPHFH